MKLNEAIRLGSMSSRKAVGKFCTSDGSRCVAGAALYAIGKSPYIGEDFDLYKSRTGKTPNRVLRMRYSRYLTMIDLNNRTNMTREQIADWLVERGWDVELSPKPMWMKITESISRKSSAAKKIENCVDEYNIPAVTIK